MADPTKGPWRFEPPRPDYLSRVGVSTCDGAVRIYDAPLTGETEANARLIALAPELAEMLRELEWVTFYDDEEGGTIERCWDCSRLRPAGHAPSCRLGKLLARLP